MRDTEYGTYGSNKCTSLRVKHTEGWEGAVGREWTMSHNDT